MQTGIIYCAKNKFNGKMYVGQTMHSLDARIKQHARKSKNAKIGFHAAIKKYGSEKL